MGSSGIVRVHGGRYLETMHQGDKLKLVIALCAEFIGTFLFQFFGGSPMGEYVNGGVMNGLLLIVIVWMTAEWSGGVVNPAVTVGLCINGVLEPIEAVLYIIVQIVGAILGAVLTTATTANEYGNCGPNSMDTVEKGDTFAFEFFATFILVWVVHMTAVSKPGAGNAAPFAIGLAIASTCGISAQYTGGFANPARFLGPLIVNSCLQSHSYVYLLAEFGGGAVAGICARVVLATKKVPEDPNESPRHTTASGDGGSGKHNDLTRTNDKEAKAMNSPMPRMGSTKGVVDDPVPTNI